MTNIQAILSRKNCGSNQQATGIYQADHIGPRYRVRVDPETDLFCVVDRLNMDMCSSNTGSIYAYEWSNFIWAGLHWQSFQDALDFIKLLEKAV